MSNPRVGLEVGPQIHHVLVSGDGFAQPSLLHQNIAQQSPVGRFIANFDEFPSDWFCFFEFVQTLKDVALQQKSIGIVSVPALDRQRALFCKLVVARIIGKTSFSNECPSQTLHHLRRLVVRTGLLLERSDTIVDKLITFLWNKSNGGLFGTGNSILNSVCHVDRLPRKPRFPNTSSNRNYEKQSKQFRLHWANFTKVR